jgi:peroxiredoxin Q/BCP
LVEEGGNAPDFSLPDQNGATVSLSDLAGSWAVLYFFPRADTPGCTTQACSVRDRAGEYAERGVRVLGCSPDTVEAQAKFAARYDLGFTLLADTDHAVCEAYGTWGKKNMYGKEYWGVKRGTVIIDPEGNVARAFPKVSPKTHDDVILAALDELRQP